MRRPFLRSTFLLSATALTLLTACGTDGSSDSGNQGTPAVAVTDPADTTPLDTTVSTDPTDTTITANSVGTTVKGSTSVDPALDATIAEIEALLGKNDQDLKDAATAAANGG